MRCCKKNVPGPKRLTGPSPLPPTLLLHSDSQVFKLLCVCVCVRQLTVPATYHLQTQQGLCELQVKQCRGAQLCLVQLAGICCWFCFALHGNNLHSLGLSDFCKATFDGILPLVSFSSKKKRFKMKNVFICGALFDVSLLRFQLRSTKSKMWNCLTSQHKSSSVPDILLEIFWKVADCYLRLL